MLLSIVTVCRNEEKRIARTIKSVLAQREIDFEYIVLDGKSTDGTLKVLESFQKDFANKGVVYKVISENDTGIYNAMNNALKYVNGEWIIYLNAGDCLYTKDLIEIINSNKNHIDIIYGDVIFVENGYYKKRKAADHSCLPVTMPMCHQSVICRTELMREYKYRENYRLAADYDFLLRSYWNGKTFEHVHEAISIYTLDGQSTTNAWKYQLEMMKSGRDVYGFNPEYQCKAFLNSVVRMTKIFLAYTFNDLYHSKKRGWKKVKHKEQ